MAVLQFLTGQLASQRVELSQPVTTLGRAGDNDIVLDEVGIARQHCKLVQSEGRFVLVDLSSAQGTFIAGERVRSRTLNDGMVVSLGRWVQFRFCAGEESVQVHHLAGEGDRDEWTGVTGIWSRSSWLREALAWTQTANFALARLACVGSWTSFQQRAVVSEFARRLRGLGSDVAVARWQEDDFVAWFPCSLENAAQRLEALRSEVVGVPFIVDESGALSLSLSAGLVEGCAGDELEVLLARADLALYQARSGGSNRIETLSRDLASPLHPVLQRRRQSRTACHIEVEGNCNAQILSGVVTNLSIGGLKLETEHPLQENDVVALRLAGQVSSAVRVVVCWKDKRGKLGTRFADGPEILRTTWVKDALQELGVTALTSRERRQQLRVEIACEMKLLGDREYSLNLINLGPGGLCVEGEDLPEPGQVLEMELAHLRASVLTVWTHPPFCGLRFVSLDGLQTRSLGLLVQQALARLRELG